MSTADYSHIPSEFQPTEGAQCDASHGRDATAGDDAATFCGAVAAYICRYRDMDDDHRERVLVLLEMQAASIGFTDFREFVTEQQAELDSMGGMMQQAM